MKNYRVQILPRAEHDIRSILEWLRQRSPRGASNWLLAFEEAIHSLESDALRFEPTAESDALNRPIMQRLFKTSRGRMYRAIFVLQDQTVFLLRVRGPGQPPLENDELEL